MKITSVTAWMWHQLHIDCLIYHQLWWCIRAKIVSLPQKLLRALHVYTAEKDLPIRLLQFLLIRESLHVCLLVCVCVCLLSTYPFVIYYLIKLILSYLHNWRVYAGDPRKCNFFKVIHLTLASKVLWQCESFAALSYFACKKRKTQTFSCSTIHQSTQPITLTQQLSGSILV